MGLSEIDGLGQARAAGPSGLAARNPFGEITVPVGPEESGCGFCVCDEICEVEFELRRCTQSLRQVSYN